jgi:tRNA threonylcarbamoyladenosine biosynthesis protein TsaB
MILLAIETSSQLGGLALMDSDNGLVAESRMNVHATHSETLLGELSHMLDRTGIRPEVIDVIAVSIGPGAFTGLRVGLGTAKGLAFATGASIVAVPTLEAFASCLPCTHRPVAPMLDARRKEVYAGLYETDRDGNVRAIIEARTVSAQEFARMLSDHGEVLFAGQGALVYRESIEKEYAGNAVFAPPALMHPSPASVAALGLRLANDGRLADPKGLRPLYLRKSEAELSAGQGQ